MPKTIEAGQYTFMAGNDNNVRSPFVILCDYMSLVLPAMHVYHLVSINCDPYIFQHLYTYQHLNHCQMWGLVMYKWRYQWIFCVIKHLLEMKVCFRVLFFFKYFIAASQPDYADCQTVVASVIIRGLPEYLDYGLSK